MDSVGQAGAAGQQRLPDGGSLAVISVDEHGCVTLLNSEAEELTGWADNDARGKPLDEVLHLANPRRGTRCTDLAARALHGGETTDLSDLAVVSARDGVQRRLTGKASPMRDAAGKIAGMVLLLRDADQARRVRVALQESEVLTRTISLHLQSGMIYQLFRLPDGSRRFSYVSDSVRQLYGISPQQAMEDAGLIYRRVHPEDRERVLRLEEEAHRTMTTFRAETRMIDPSGAIRWSSFVSTPRLLPDGSSCWDGIEFDIGERIRAEKERMRLQEQLAQAQKMESLGQLAGGVAHGFNNMLSVILGNAEMALERAELPAPLRAELGYIREAAQHSASLTRQLLAFARRQTAVPTVIDLNKTVAGMLEMLRMLIGEGIDLVWEPAADTGRVLMDSDQLNQVLTNLLVNARDAISGAGRVAIETGTVVLDAAQCAEHPGVVPGAYVTLTVSDDGCGMDARIMARLFEPFFTTKEPGRGTGIGLAVVYGIVTQNHGFISVRSELGKGTTLRIHLPRHAGAVPHHGAVLAPPATVGGNETILLVEDEQVLLDMSRRMLCALGYTVLVADTPDKAIRLAGEHPGQIRLLVTDVVMPAMNGRELAQRVQSRHPDMRLLYMSGYTADVIARHGIVDDGLHFLQKPFSKQELDAKVREALESPQTSP